MKPNDILAHVRKLIEEHAGSNPDRWWYANRFVFARLMLDERKTKTVIKKRLFESNQPCHHCGESFEARKGVHLHRLDGNRGYSDDNCVLMHGDCHEKFHATHQDAEDRRPAGDAVIVKRSKKYDEMPFVYWWDIASKMAECLDEYEAVVFACKDTGDYCQVPVLALRGYLTEDRQTSRGEGNWGIKVLKDRPDELAFEPVGRGKWLFLPVVWINEESED